jgi:hypothetical protein
MKLGAPKTEIKRQRRFAASISAVGNSENDYSADGSPHKPFSWIDGRARGDRFEIGSLRPAELDGTERPTVVGQEGRREWVKDECVSAVFFGP